MFTLGRKIDIHYPTNRWISIIAILVTGTSYFFTKDFSTAWKTGASIFLTWALTREIDPKREYGAFASTFFAFSSFFVAFKVDLLAVFFLLLGIRFVSEITGNKNTILDRFTLLAMAVFLSYSGQTSVYILILLLGLYLKMKNKENKKMDIVFFLITTLALLGQVFILERSILPVEFLLANWMIKISGISLIIYIGFILIDKDKSVLDDNGKIVKSQKILSGQIFFGLSIFLLFFTSRLPIGNVIVYLSSIWGYILYGCFANYIPK